MEVKDKNGYLKALSEVLPDVGRTKPSPSDVERIFYQDVIYELRIEGKTFQPKFKTGSLKGIRIPVDAKRLRWYTPLSELFVDTVRFWIVRSYVNVKPLVRPSVRDRTLIYDLEIGDLYVRVAEIAPIEPSLYHHREGKVTGHVIIGLVTVPHDVDAGRVLLRGLFEELSRERSVKFILRHGLRQFLPIMLEHPDLSYYILVLTILHTLSEQAIDVYKLANVILRVHIVRQIGQPWIQTYTIGNLPEVYKTLEAALDSLKILGINTVGDLSKHLLNMLRYTLDKIQDVGFESLISIVRLFLDSIFKGVPDCDMLYRLERYWGIKL